MYLEVRTFLWCAASSLSTQLWLSLLPQVFSGLPWLLSLMKKSTFSTVFILHIISNIFGSFWKYYCWMSVWGPTAVLLQALSFHWKPNMFTVFQKLLSPSRVTILLCRQLGNFITITGLKSFDLIEYVLLFQNTCINLINANGHCSQRGGRITTCLRFT